jgi:hypothetical protein
MKSLRCMVGRHKWHTEYTADRQPFLLCSRCRLDGPTPAGPQLARKPRRLAPHRRRPRRLRRVRLHSTSVPHACPTAWGDAAGVG